MAEHQSYTELIARSFLQNRNRLALIDFQGERNTYEDVAEKVQAIHNLFRKRGIKEGDRVAICGKNCSNWAVAFIAATTYGTVAVPLLHEFTPENITNAIEHSGASVLFASDEIYNKIADSVGNLLCVSLRSMDIMEGGLRTSFRIKPMKDYAAFCHSFHQYAPEDLLVLNYTSGTTSSPKGVMIPERAVVSNILFGYEVMPVLNCEHSVVSLLPLAHTYSMSFELLVEFTLGMRIYFLTGRMHTGYIFDAFEEAKPKVIIMVPLILEKIVKKGVFPVIAKPGVAFLRRIPGIRSLVNNKIRDELYNKLGGNFYQVIIGGAGLDPEVESVLMSVKFPFTVGYGMTECAPIICYSDWKDFRAGTCGKAAPRMALSFGRRFGDACEVLAQGDNVMLGYYRNPEATAEVLDSDGWLHTGDLGTMDGEGNLKILGRCKTMFLSATGQNVYPEEVEAVVSNIKYVKECLAVNREDQIEMLVYLDADEIRRDGLSQNDLRDYENRIRMEANVKLPAYSRISRVTFMDKPFEKTPKMSIKRFLYN